jgi:DNA-binding NarL/FixJ family response regulator
MKENRNAQAIHPNPPKMTSSTATVAIVEDDPGIRAGWSALINQMNGYRCIGEYGSAEEALRELPLHPADLVLMDIGLPQLSGIECTRRLTQILPGAEIIMLTMFGDQDHLFESLRAGACGYLLKRSTPQALREALDQARSGGAPMSPQIARQVVTHFRSRPTPAAPDTGVGCENLSKRESEVIQLLAEGHPYKNIADALGITIDTVRTYIRRIYQKLQVNSRTEAVVRYLSETRASN